MIKRTLYFGNPAYLSLRLRQLVIKVPEVKANSSEIVGEEAPNYNVKTVPIEDIGLVVLDNAQITITSGLMAALLENNCVVLSCDTKHMPAGMSLALSGNTLHSERNRLQIEASLPLKKQLWQQTVQCKIKNQAAVLKYSTGENYSNMERWANKVRSGDPENLEGRAAAFYWKTLFVDAPDFIRGQDDIRNAMLDYGYAVLRAIVARALVGSGLIMTLGIHHHNRYDAFCLANDIMEPYRPYVDKSVLDMFSAMNPDSLSPEIKRGILGLPVTEVLLDGTRKPLMLAVGLTVNSLQKCFSGESRKLAYPVM